MLDLISAADISKNKIRNIFWGIHVVLDLALLAFAGTLFFKNDMLKSQNLASTVWIQVEMSIIVFQIPYIFIILK